MAIIMARYRKPGKVKGWDFPQIKFSSEGPRINYRRVVESYLDRNQKLLDIGTGGGEKFLKFAPKVKEAIGIDVDPKMIETARENLRKSGLPNVKFEVCDSEKLKFGNREFDVVIDRQAPFNPKEVARVLKPGGVFITQQVSEGDKLNFKKIFQRGDSYGIKPGTLENRYLRELQEAGMKIIEEKTANTIEYYRSMDDVIFLLANTPIVPDFDFEREQDKLKQIEERFTTEKGIKMNAERFLIVAKKPEK
jgi:ubiquinone/menaquinone biosynthesis C-methylase UbiE